MSTRTVPRRHLLIISIMLLLLSGMSVSMAPSADADYSYYTYQSRSTVKARAGVFTGGAYFCKKAPWYVSAACIASVSKYTIIYDYAAYRDCKMRIKTTINTSSKYSFDKATHTYQPYQCRK